METCRRNLRRHQALRQSRPSDKPNSLAQRIGSIRTHVEGIVRLIVQRGDQTLGAAYCTDAHRLSLYHRHRFPTEIISHSV